MKTKKTAIISSGQIVPLGPKMTVRRVIPNYFTKQIGPFVFLDHMGPIIQKPQTDPEQSGTGAHPHRGIITFTYLFSGEVMHHDSRGNHSVVSSGGVQWMKAGNGIIHDEGPTKQFLEKGGVLHGIQLWINLPAAIKAEDPEYEALPAHEIPEIILPENTGIIRMLLGTYQNTSSPLKNYSPLHHFHLILNPDKEYQIETISGYEYGIYLPEGQVHIGENKISSGEFAEISHEGEHILLSNQGTEPLNILVYGGEALNESVHAEGPFVMNTATEAAIAYRDYFNGKYGEINPNDLN